MSHQLLCHLGPTMMDDINLPAILFHMTSKLVSQILRLEEIAHPNSSLIPKKILIQFLQKLNGMKTGYKERRTVVIKEFYEN